jgi:hypothetical protein
VRVIDRGGPGGVPATLVSTPGPQRSFPTPNDLLGSPTPLSPPTAAAPALPTAAAPTWPGMNLDWPQLMPFGQSTNEPPPGPGGGTVDPFKRARGNTPAQPTPGL